MRPYAVASAALAPVVLIGGWTWAAARQPAGYDPVRDTISALAARHATDRWIMTAALAALGACHLITASGLTEATIAGRSVLAFGGLATIMVAALPQPSTGHVPAAIAGFVALAVWPALSGAPSRRAARSATAFLVLLLGWLAVELHRGSLLGLSERLVAGSQALWPLVLVIALLRASRVSAHGSTAVARRNQASALAAFRRGDDAEAARLARVQLEDARSVDDAEATVEALCMLARVALRQNDLIEVQACAQTALELAQSAGQRRLERIPLHMRAVAARMSGRLEQAREFYLRSIALNEDLGEAVTAAAEHRNLAYLELQCGHRARARELLTECAGLFQSLDAPSMAPYLIFDQASIAALDGDYASATAYLATAKARWAEQGTVPDPDDAVEVQRLERELAASPDG